MKYRLKRLDGTWTRWYKIPKNGIVASKVMRKASYLSIQIIERAKSK